LTWLKDNGGIKAMEAKNIAKAKLLYDEIDRNKLFTTTVPNPEDRSLMNVTYVMAPGYEQLEKSFLALAKERNILGIEGHRSVGGFRASIYNAMPIESVGVLVQAMKDFEAQN
jgi:phosphoserine aminotransferase